MLKIGRACLRGYRMEMVVIQLWITLCWLLPVALELLLRRAMPGVLLQRPWCQVVLLVGSFLLNRLLLAPAHCGYYERCHRLALKREGDLAATCELPVEFGTDFGGGMRSFFREYRHPVQALKWQLRWDMLRCLGYFVALFPGLFLVAIGAVDPDAVWQATVGGSGIFLMVAGLMLMWLWLRRLTPVLYRYPQHRPFWKTLADAYRSTRHKTGKLTAAYGWYYLLWPLFCCPVLPLRAAFFVQQASICQRLRVPTKNPIRARLFHTRVLNET